MTGIDRLWRAYCTYCDPRHIFFPLGSFEISNQDRISQKIATMAVELPIVPATSPDHQVKSAQLADNESRLPTLERQLREISISTAKELKIATLRELTETKTKVRLSPLCGLVAPTNAPNLV